MKSKLIYIATAILTMVICIVLYKFNINNKLDRVHQHKDSRWEAIKTEENREFQTHLPIIKIDTRGQKIPGETITMDGEIVGYTTTDNGEGTIKTDFSVIDLQKGLNSITDNPTLSSVAEIRYRGNSSRFFNKKSYSIHLVLEDGKENKKEIAGMSSHDEWVLNGPFLDRTLMRNYLALNVSGEIMEYAPSVRYCEVILDGEYQGIYLLMESISRGKGRINIPKPDKKSKITSYIIRWDREGKGNQELNNYAYYTYKSGISALDIRFPGINQITDNKNEYITEDISKIEKNLYSYDLTSENNGYIKYIDLNSFAEYFIINEFFRNIDAGRFSTFYYKDARGKLKTSVWDFNNGCDNYIDYPQGNSGFSMINAPLFDVLIKDKNFVDTVINKYRKLREDVLSERYLINYIDETSLWLGDSLDRNYEVWGYVFDLSNYNAKYYLTPVERNFTSYEESVNQLKDFIIARGNWLDNHIESLYQYSHESKNINELIK